MTNFNQIDPSFEKILEKFKLESRDFLFKKIEEGFIIEYPQTLFRFKFTHRKYSHQRVDCWPQVQRAYAYSHLHIFQKWIENFIYTVENDNIIDIETSLRARFLNEIGKRGSASDQEYLRTKPIYKALDIRRIEGEKMVISLINLDYLAGKRGMWSGKYDKIKLLLDGKQFLKIWNKSYQPEEKVELKRSSQDNFRIESKNFDVALSFSGEQREYVKRVANYLRENQASVYYDEFEQVDMWGKDLYRHLLKVYSEKCKFCVVFLSKSYEQKLWTNHELRGAQERAFSENREYILPVRFDDIPIPGMPKTISYIDANRIGPSELGKMIIEKLNTVD